MMNLCARSEKSTGDARRLLLRWGVEPTEHEKIIRKLESEKYIDDRRYAAAFVREKLNLSGWGIYKIKSALRAKQVAEAVIDEAMGEVDNEAIGVRLEDQLRRKMRSVKATNSHDLRAKLIRFGMSRGFDFDRVCETTDRVLRDSE